LRESIDTTTPGGKLVFHVFWAVAEFERDLILERTTAGLEAAKARGRRGGRKPAMDECKIALASRLMRDRTAPRGFVGGSESDDTGMGWVRLWTRWFRPN
jgi:DNA invertase Pin-like site-specific DNA recombinase